VSVHDGYIPEILSYVHVKSKAPLPAIIVRVCTFHLRTFLCINGQYIENTCFYVGDDKYDIIPKSLLYQLKYFEKQYY